MKKRIEISTIVCAMLVLLGSGGCGPEKDHQCKDNDICVPEASCVPNVTTGENWCTKWENKLSASMTSDWKDAVIGNKYEVDFEASGGFPPYTWVLNDGKNLSPNLGWLELVPGGANNETAKLQNKFGQGPGTGDISDSGFPVNITVYDSSIRGKSNRDDNKGIVFDENLIIRGCPSNSCGTCGAQTKCKDKMNPKDTTCNIVGNSTTGTIEKCWYDDTYGCLVLLGDQNIPCSGNETCTVAGDGTVTCTCNTGWAGANCDCKINCTNKNCGDDGCGGSCGTCGSPATCGGSGTCGYLSLVLVPGGAFNRDATYTSAISSAFHMSETEITRDQFNAVMGFDPSDTTYSSGTTDPVQNVNWYHALVFCNKLSKAENLTPVYTISGSTDPKDWGTVPTTANDPTWDKVTAKWDANGYRLPTEMEWMWAAMGATAGTTGYTKAFAGSTGINVIGDYAVFGYFGTEAGRTTTARTNPVRSKNANELGLYDMSGNVWEWCWDWYGTYPSENRIDYTGAASGASRVLRGGSWLSYASYAAVAARDYAYPSSRNYGIGFRVVRP
jgi:sulfatase modifying factor 1